MEKEEEKIMRKKCE